MASQNVRVSGVRSASRATDIARGPARSSHAEEDVHSVSPQKLPIRILIADFEGVFRLGLSRLFAAEGGLSVVAQVDEPGQLIPRIRELQPDVVFAQADMLKDRIQFLAGVREACPGVKLMVTASELSDDEALACVKAGACGVILKSADTALFVKCARKITKGEIWLPKRQVARMAQFFSKPQNSTRPADTLTRREKLVISCLAQGLRNREIAERLTITEQTVKNHLRSVYDKVGVSDRLELVLYAIHQHLELPPVNSEPAP